MCSTNDIHMERCRKHMVNVGVNTMTALLWLDCAGLAEDAGSMQFVVAVADDTNMGASASGVEIGVIPAEHVRDPVARMESFMPLLAPEIFAGRKPETVAFRAVTLRLAHSLQLEIPMLQGLRARANAWMYSRSSHT